MDRVVGASFFGSSNNASKSKSDKYKSRSHGRSHIRNTNNGDVELSSVRRKPKDPNGLTFLDHEGSEENILANERDSVKLEGSTDDQKDGITRTDEVVVSYSPYTQSVKGPKTRARAW